MFVKEKQGKKRQYLHTYTHVHQSWDWFQEIFYYLYYSKAANHNHSLSSLHPPPPLPTTSPPPPPPPIPFCVSPCIRYTSLSPAIPCAGVPKKWHVRTCWKSLIERRKTLVKKKGKKTERVRVSFGVSLRGSDFPFSQGPSRSSCIPFSLFRCLLLALKLRSGELIFPGESQSQYLYSHSKVLGNTGNTQPAGVEMKVNLTKQQAAGKTLFQSCPNHSTTKDKRSGIAIISYFTAGLRWVLLRCACVFTVWHSIQALGSWSSIHYLILHFSGFD